MHLCSQDLVLIGGFLQVHEMASFGQMLDILRTNFHLTEDQFPDEMASALFEVSLG
jgi:hypothetical protein